MINSFFQMRDELVTRLHAAGSGHVRSDATALHVFTALMSFAVYDKRQECHGYVSRKATSVKFLAEYCMLSERSVKRALHDLENAGMIIRERLVGPHGWVPSDIRLCWVEGQTCPKGKVSSSWDKGT